MRPLCRECEAMVGRVQVRLPIETQVERKHGMFKTREGEIFLNTRECEIEVGQVRMGLS